jgi:hypothetical protein
VRPTMAWHPSARSRNHQARRLVQLGPNPCWTWTDDPVSGFWARRTGRETEIHGWDGTNAVGAPLAIDPTLASDRSRQVADARCVDVAGWWAATARRCTCTAPARQANGSFDLQPMGWSSTREHAKGDVAVRGLAADLFLLLTRRLSLSSAPEVALIRRRVGFRHLV